MLMMTEFSRDRIESILLTGIDVIWTWNPCSGYLAYTESYGVLLPGFIGVWRMEGQPAGVENSYDLTDLENAVILTSTSGEIVAWNDISFSACSP